MMKESKKTRKTMERFVNAFMLSKGVPIDENADSSDSDVKIPDFTAEEVSSSGRSDADGVNDRCDPRNGNEEATNEEDGSEEFEEQTQNQSEEV